MKYRLSSFFIISLLGGFIALIIGCKKDPIDSETPSKIYAFERDDKPTVFYRGQTVRHLLIQDLKIFIDRLSQPNASPVSFEDLYKYYDNNNVTIPGVTLTPVNGHILKSQLFSISPIRDLKFRVNPEYGDEITANIQEWCQTIADNSQNPEKLGTFWVYIDPETGYDLGEMFQKTALGGVAWSHGLNTYFKGVETKNNADLVTIFEDVYPYTQMEHHFDEAFGYFGAARNFLDFSDEDLSSKTAGSHYRDNFIKDGKIDFETEYNYAYAVEAARRDLSSIVQTDYSQTIFNSFFEARNAIVRQDYDSLVILKEIILNNWEEVVAATAIHYLNITIELIEPLAENPENPEFSHKDFFENWSAMFKYTEMLRYNYNNRFTEWESVLHEKYETSEVPFPKALIDEPVKAKNYIENLFEVRETFRGIYNFPVENVLNW